MILLISFRVSKDGNENEKHFIRVDQDGNVAWLYPSILHSSCMMDMTYFPWDKQVCGLEFGSWAYPMSVIDIANYTPEEREPGGDTTVFIMDGQWTFVDFPVERQVYVHTPGNVSTLLYTIHLQRKPLYFVSNVLVPAISISLCGLLVFLLPPDSGEKVSLSVTILLADSVFLLIIQESTPVQSLVIPRISKQTHIFMLQN